MTSICLTIFKLWPILECNAAYWALALCALIFTCQYHLSILALYSKLTASMLFPTIVASHQRQRQPLLNGISLRAWRVATFLVMISQTYLAIFTAQLTYSWIHKLQEWELRQEDGSRPVIILNVLLLCIWIISNLHFQCRGYFYLIQNAMLFFRMGELPLFRDDIEMQIPPPLSKEEKC